MNSNSVGLQLKVVDFIEIIMDNLFREILKVTTRVITLYVKKCWWPHISTDNLGTSS